jgi:cytochrome c-type biogenesis protein CcmF
VFFPLLAPAAFLMGVGPMARWRNASLPNLWTRLKWALGVAAVAAVILPLILGRWSPLIAAGLFLALWIVVSSVVNLRERLAGSHRQGLVAKLAANSASYYGMLLAHLGVAVFIVGVTLVKGYESEQDVPLDVGQTTEVGGYAFKFLGVVPGRGPNYRALTGTVEVRKDGRLIETLKPEKRIYNASGQTMTIAAIDVGLLGDRYVSLGEPLAADAINGAWGVRIYLKPFIDWIWMGAFLMALGGFIAVCDRRYRLAIRRRTAPSGAAAGAAAPAD